MILGQHFFDMILIFLFEFDFSSYKADNMIEMDQFVARLSGQELEIIERQSTESAATMKYDTGELMSESDFTFS